MEVVIGVVVVGGGVGWNLNLRYLDARSEGILDLGGRDSGGSGGKNNSQESLGG